MSFFDNIEKDIMSDDIISTENQNYLYFETDILFNILLKNTTEDININGITVKTLMEIFDFDELDHVAILMECDEKYKRNSDDLVLDFDVTDDMFSKDITYFIKQYLKYSIDKNDTN